MWFYSIVGSVPILNHVNGNHRQLYIPSISFNKWEWLKEYPCVVYFNDSNFLNYDEDRYDESFNIPTSYDKDKYDILFKNKRGIILKRKKAIE